MIAKANVLFFLMFGLAAASIGSIASVARAESTPDALKLDMTQDGLDALAREIQSRYMHDIDSRKIDDILKTLPNGWDMETRGLKYSVDFKKLNLRATKEGIRVEFAVDGVNLHADSMRVSRSLLWWTIASTCSGVDVSVAGSAETAMALLMMPIITDAGNLDADLRELTFTIDPDAYVVQGPMFCSGILGLGSYMKDAIAGVLAGARAQVADIVKQQVSGLLPEAIAHIDGMMHQSYELHVGYPGVPFSQDILLTASPAAIEAHDGRLVFVMSTELSAASKKEFLEGRQQERRMSTVPPGVVFGSLGLNKKVINDALGALHPAAQQEFELTPDWLPQLRDYLTTDTLANVWPDLNELDLETTEVRAFISCPGLPSVQPIMDPVSGPVDSNGSKRAMKFGVNIPDAILSVMVKVDGAWIKYANINAHLSVPLAIEMEDGELEVQLAEPGVVAISGSWAAGYQPTIDIFEADLAQVIVKSLFEMAYLRGPLLQLMVPLYDFGGGRMAFSNPRSDDPFFSIDLIAAKR